MHAWIKFVTSFIHIPLSWVTLLCDTYLCAQFEQKRPVLSNHLKSRITVYFFLWRLSLCAVWTERLVLPNLSTIPNHRFIYFCGTYLCAQFESKRPVLNNYVTFLSIRILAPTSVNHAVCMARIRGPIALEPVLHNVIIPGILGGSAFEGLRIWTFETLLIIPKICNQWTTCILHILVFLPKFHYLQPIFTCMLFILPKSFKHRIPAPHESFVNVKCLGWRFYFHV